MSKNNKQHNEKAPKKKGIGWFIFAAILLIGGLANIGSNPETGVLAIACAVIIFAILGLLKFITGKKRRNAETGFSSSEKPAEGLKPAFGNGNVDGEIALKRQELMDFDDELLFQSFGVYKPRYPFSTVDGFKEKLDSVRQKQKQMIRDSIACEAPSDIAYNNSLKEGAKIVNDWVKLMLRAFNGECDAIIMKANFNNIEQLEKRIRKSAEEITKIGQRMRISIRPSYVDLKVEELHVAYEYELFKEQEKERIRAIREEEREKALAEKELAAARAKVEKDLKRVSGEIESLNAKMETASEAEAEAIRRRLAQLESDTSDLNEQLDHIDVRTANVRSGWVYVISNIGSFGENVYKIGMTRRDQPQERVDELGDASVPFRFDVHAFIFSTDAVALETALHHRFSDRRVNLVNQRKEFFNVSLDEIEKEVKANHNEVVEFIRTAAAQEYRESEQIRRGNVAA